MKSAFLSLLLLASAAAHAESPQDVAIRTISAEAATAYNPVNATDAELNQAAAINAQLRLRTLMLGDTVSEE